MKDGWEIKKLGEVCDIINGFAFKSQLFKDCGDDILRISNIQNGIIDDSDIAHFSKEDYPKVNFEKYAVLPNDIVVALSGATTGKFGINNTGRKLYLNQRVAICREKTNEIHHLFLLYFLKTQSKSFLESAAGVAQPNLSTEQMKQYDIFVPPLAEQEKIVAELDYLSGIIEKKKQQLKEYDALAQSIFYEMFIPANGTLIKLSQACSIVSGLVNPNEAPYCNYPHIGGANIESNTGEFINVKLAKDENLISGKYFFDNTMILYSKIRPNLNKVALPSFCGICSADMYPIIPTKGFNKIFLKFILTQKDFLEYAVSHSGRANIPKINRGDLLEYEFLSYPLSAQQEFASKIEAIEKQKALIKKSIEEVETLFNSRMDQYFN